MASKYTFSGHESFPCKTLWLKKGYDFVRQERDFNSPNAVIYLGVGKNMVSSIRFWLKVFGVYSNDGMSTLGNYLFDDKEGKDRFLEDMASLWLLHFLLIFLGEASLYCHFFIDFQKERKIFSRDQLVESVQRRLREEGKEVFFNANTVKKDVGVLLQNYCLPQRNSHSNEDFSSLLIDLDLIRQKEEHGKNSYFFNIEGKRHVTPEIFFYGLLMMKGNDKSVSYDLLQTLGLIFCMTDLETIDMLKYLSEKYSHYMTYTDVAGIRQVQFTNDVEPFAILDEYYEKN